MIPVFGVPTICRPDIFNRMIASIDEEIERFIVVDNSTDHSAVAGIDWRGHSPTIISPGHNLGVSASWNLIIKSVPRAPWWGLFNFDLIFAPGDLASLAAAMTDHSGIALLGSFAAVGISRSAIARAGWFDENFIPAYCLVPETPVLTDDLRWVSIGELSVGDGLIGVDEQRPGYATERRYARSRVTGLASRKAPCVRVELADGRSVVCTLDHRWLAKPPARTMSWEWRTASTLGPGYRLMVPLDPWAQATTFEEGWLAGILDGEGCLHHTAKMSGVAISQKPGPVLDRIKFELERMQIPFTWRVRPSGVAIVEISSRRRAMQLLGSLRPTRLLRPEIWEGRSPRSRTHQSAISIVSIKHVGNAEVVSMETSTRTFIANGAVSHNCEDNDFTYRCRLTGVEQLFLPAGYTHLGSSVISSDLHYRRENDRTYPANVTYYVEKWGGPMGNETLPTPFNRDGSPADWRLDPERLATLTWREK